jgi:hypothetical protein
VIDRIIPADQDPGGCDLGADDYVIAQLGGEARQFAEDILNGLEALELASRLNHNAGFLDLSEHQKDTLLATFEMQPWFLALTELTAEGFYADPANGGNRGARSWEIIGYEHRLPDGPSGRVGAEVAISSAELRREWPYPPGNPSSAAPNSNSRKR